MNYAEIKKGMVIEGPFWPEPVKIDIVENIDEYIHIVGATIRSNEYVDRLIPMSDLEKLKIKEFALNFSAPADETFLYLEAQRYRFASLFDPLLAMHTSKIDPLPFQIEAVYGYILKLPRIRFLIADDPGAGKTIMAGLIIKELKLRGIINRFLIVAPGHLKDQWRRELKDRFQETVTVLDRNYLDSLYGENAWQKENQVITSIDFSKQNEILPTLDGVHWDLIVVDEAHKMSAYKYGEKISKTLRYKLGELLSKNSDHLLFLTATPHKGDPENFRLFLDLLVPGFFSTQELIDESLKNKDNPLFIRRMKEDLKDFDGKPIFPNRCARTIKFRLTEKEKKLYNELSEYVVSQYNKALKSEKKRNIAFALLILQRRMASSTYALLKSLERRRQRLEELLQETEIKKELPLSIDLEELEEIENYEEQERWKEEKKWETLSIAENKEELKNEISTLKKLEEAAKDILNEESEIKLKELKKVMEALGNEKILIFTESKDTMEYLVWKIKSLGYSVNYIHGEMRLENRIEAEKVFQQETQVMVATEAAGEGINLQFCHLMINYDIPWNPNRLEQRMGRIHRYGQQKEVHIFNLVAEDTREGQVLTKLFEKLEEIRDALGNDKVFDIIGNVFVGKNLYQLILEAVANARSIEEIIEELEIKVDEKYIAEIKEMLGESLATRHIDYTRIKEMAEKAKEYRLIPEYVEEFFKQAFEKAGGKWRIRRNGFIAIDSIPYEIRKIAEGVNFKNKYGPLLKSYSKVTFDKDIAFKNPDAEFISFGNPLLEALLEWVNENYSSHLQKGATFIDESGKFNGIFWFFEGEVKDGKGETVGKKLLTIYDDGTKLEEINATILWDLKPSSNAEPINMQINKEKAQSRAITALEIYKQELSKERKRQAEIKKKYGVKSLEKLIEDLDAELVRLYEKEEMGEKISQVEIKNKEEKKKRYETALETLKIEIERETNLTITMPKLLGAIIVKSSKNEEMIEDEEIERIGMEIAMKYERDQGRIPEDVSRENLGFDIRSKGEKEIRYIEVKARRGEGDVALTRNEWLKARRFKDQYWLYVVANATENPTLYLIQNPAENLNAKEKVEITHFIVTSIEWKNKGIKTS